MKRVLCLLLAMMLLPLQAMASLDDNLAAPELDVILLDNRTELDQTALRDGSDSTGYDPRSANSFAFAAEISQEQPLYQVFLRLNALPASAEIQAKNPKGSYAAVASVQNPGAEFTIASSEPITGSIRLVIRFEKSTRLQLTECRLFGKGRLPATLHINTIEVLDLYVYNITIASGGTTLYSFATAIGILKTVVSVTLLFSANFASKKLRGESIM